MLRAMKDLAGAAVGETAGSQSGEETSRAVDAPRMDGGVDVAEWA